MIRPKYGLCSVINYEIFVKNLDSSINPWTPLPDAGQPIFTNDEMCRLNMPALLLGGTKGIMRDLGKIEARLCGLVPHLKTVILPKTGHALLNTTDAVLGFLTR